MKKAKKAMKRLLKGVMPKTAYCIWIDKKHHMKYRSTIAIGSSYGCKRAHVNVCDNCKKVNYVCA